MTTLDARSVRSDGHRLGEIKDSAIRAVDGDCQRSKFFILSLLHAF